MAEKLSAVLLVASDETTFHGGCVASSDVVDRAARSAARPLINQSRISAVGRQAGVRWPVLSR
jgi:hypothetical protein